MEPEFEYTTSSKIEGGCDHHRSLHLLLATNAAMGVVWFVARSITAPTDLNFECAMFGRREEKCRLMRLTCLHNYAACCCGVENTRATTYENARSVKE
jgi:hypothetical protein